MADEPTVLAVVSEGFKTAQLFVPIIGGALLLRFNRYRQLQEKYNRAAAMDVTKAGAQEQVRHAAHVNKLLKDFNDYVGQGGAVWYLRRAWQLVPILLGLFYLGVAIWYWSHGNPIDLYSCVLLVMFGVSVVYAVLVIRQAVKDRTTYSSGTTEAARKAAREARQRNRLQVASNQRRRIHIGREK